MRVASRPTRTPTPPAPSLVCPKCTHPLDYVETVFSGMPKSTERWDMFHCRPCGARFEYRHRTRRLRSLQGLGGD